MLFYVNSKVARTSTARGRVNHVGIIQLSGKSKKFNALVVIFTHLLFSLVRLQNTAHTVSLP